MKIFRCDICGDLWLADSNDRSCECGNVSGKYTDHKHMKFKIKYPPLGRMIAFSNFLIQGWQKECVCYVFDDTWDEEYAKFSMRKIIELPYRTNFDVVILFYLSFFKFDKSQSKRLCGSQPLETIKNKLGAILKRFLWYVQGDFEYD